MALPFVDNRRLIQCVQMHEMLYVGNHPKYSDSRFKEEIWDKIAYVLAIPVSLCKRSWFNLRDSYRRALRKRRDAFNDGLPYRRWRYEDEMEFLAPHISIRDCNDRPIDPTPIQNEPTGDILSNEADDPTYEPKLKRRRVDRPLLHATSSHAAESYESSSRNLHLDHVDAFLLGIGATLKSFTPRTQNLAKAKIFNLVSEMEMQQILEFKEQWRDGSLPQPENVVNGHVVKQEIEKEDDVECEEMVHNFASVYGNEKDGGNKNGVEIKVEGGKVPQSEENEHTISSNYTYDQYSTSQ